MSAVPMSRLALGAYIGLYPIGVRKAVLRVSKGYKIMTKHTYTHIYIYIYLYRYMSKHTFYSYIYI